MDDVITTNDYLLLTSCGFRAHFAEVILWKDDEQGNHWQAQLGEGSTDPIVFIKHKPDFRRFPSELLTRDRFVSLFIPEQRKVA